MNDDEIDPRDDQQKRLLYSVADFSFCSKKDTASPK
jgi:hypothetical protein